jgi:RHS repeat-associated protein
MTRPSDWWVLDLERDPTPGDPQRVGDLAGTFERFADDVGSALRDIRGLEGDSAVQEWVGQSGDAYREQFGETPGELTKLERSYRMAGDALAGYWPQLDQAQGQADRALELGRAARAERDAAQADLTNAQDWVGRANAQAQQHQQVPAGAPPPDPEQVRAATRNATQAAENLTRARGAADSAQGRLDAAKRLAEQAAQLRDDAAGRCARSLHEASDAGIKNRRWWQKAVDWVVDHWDEIITVCKWVVAIGGIIVMIIGGPLAWVIVGVAVLVLADTIRKYAQGKATLWEVAFAALDCIPMTKGLTSLGRLKELYHLGGLRAIGGAGLTAARGHLGSLANGVRTFAESSRTSLRAGMTGLRENAVPFLKRMVTGDPVDVATGEMVQQQTDVELPGLLPLVLARTHVSSYRVGRWFGPSWASTLDQRIEADAEGVCYATADGMLLAYPAPGGDAAVLPAEGPRWPLARVDEGFTVDVPERGHTLFFAPAGDPAMDVFPLAAIADRNGHRIDFDYAPDGALAGVRHSGGYRIAVEVTDGLVTALRLLGEDEAGDRELVRFGYSPGARLTEVVNSSGLPLRFGYDEEGRITSWEDRNGTRYEFAYDPAGRCVRGTGSDGCLNATFDYDPDARVTVAVNSLGHATTYQLNDAVQVVREVDPLGHATFSEWDRHDRLLARTDPLGRTVRYSYDAAGNLVRVIRPDGVEATAAYNELGLPVAITEPGGAVWRREYDQRGNLTAVTDPLGATTRYTYDPRGRLAEVTDALGATRRVEADAAGLPVAVTDPLGATVRYDRDAFGRVIAITDPAGGVTRLGWTVEGKLASRVLPDGAAERWAYDGEGNLVEHVDAVGQATRCEATHFDLPSARTGPDGARLEFGYDTELRLVSVTNPQGLVWRYDYDPAGNLIAETDFNGRRVGYAYDTAGQLVERVNGTGEITRFARDALGNVVEKRSGESVATFAYDAAGRVVRAANADAEVTYERDALGRVLAEACNGRTVTSAYDPLGQRVSRRTPSGAESVWEHDPAGAPTALHVAGQTMRFGYDEAGREVERRFGSGAVLAQTWDPASRLAAQTLTARGTRLVQRRSYGYRPDGYLMAVEDQLAGSRRFDLDPVGRVTAVHGAGWTERYAYDPAGNITDAHWPAPSPNGSPDADMLGPREYAGTLIRQAGNVRYEHDAQGRVTLRQQKQLSAKPRTWRYSWDAEDRLTAVTTPDGQQWSYRYDPFGRRIAKQRIVDDGITAAEQIDFTWDGFVLAEQTVTGLATVGQTITWDWEPESFRPLAQTERPSPRDASQDEIDERFYVIVTDLVGAPTELVTPTGDIAWHPRTTLWGSPLPADPGQADCPLRFPGQYHDPETGLNYNYHRYYDPTTARYDSPDPLGLYGGPEPNNYVSNPNTWIDPLGLTRKWFNHPDGWTFALDSFDVSGAVDFEIHVFKGGTEIGLFGSDGWFAKHRLGTDIEVPIHIENHLKGIAVDFMRRTGRIGPKGIENIAGDLWRRPRLGCVK